MVSARQTAGLHFKLNYAKNQSNPQNSKVLRKWKFDSLWHCEAIKAGYDLEEIISENSQLIAPSSQWILFDENFSSYATSTSPSSPLIVLGANLSLSANL